MVVATAGAGDATLHDSGEVVGIDLSRGKYFALNDTASHIWRLIAEPRSVAEICAQVEQEHEVDRERLELEVVAFLESLVAHDLASVVHAQAQTPRRTAG